MNCSCRRRSRSDRPRVARGLSGGLLAAALLLAVPVHAAPPASDHARYRVIVSADVPATSVTLVELRRIVLGEQRFWKNRQPLALIMPGQQTPSRRFVLDHIANLTEPAYRRHMLELMYRGELEYAPKVADSDVEAVTLVAAGNGAITLVRDGTSLPAGVHSLQVNGRTPEDANYPLMH